MRSFTVQTKFIKNVVDVGMEAEVVNTEKKTVCKFLFRNEDCGSKCLK